MTRPAFADIFDLAQPLPMMATDDAPPLETAVAEEDPFDQIEKFIAKRRRRRKTS